MSILETLQNHISRYKGMEVLTEFPGKQSGYALQPSGNDKTREDVLGNKYYTNNYVFWVKEIARDEVDRITRTFWKTFRNGCRNSRCRSFREDSRHKSFPYPTAC